MIRAARLIILILLFGVPVITVTHAQDEDGTIRLVDVEFKDNYVVSVPDNWVVWRREDYATKEAAEEGLRRAYEESDSLLALIGVLPGEVDFLVLSMLQPEQSEVGYGHVTVVTDSVNRLAGAARTSVDVLTPRQLMTALGLEFFREVQVNGRPTAFGNQRSTSGLRPYQALYFFREDDLVISITGSRDETFDSSYQELLPVLLASVRKWGEDYDVEAYKGLTGDDVPANIVLPTKSDLTRTRPCTLSTSRRTNLRTGPSTTSAMGGTLSPDTRVVAVGQTKAGDGFTWWQLEDQLWVRSDIVTATGECEALPLVNP